MNRPIPVRGGSLTRRRFLGIAGLSLAASAGFACSPSGPATSGGSAGGTTSGQPAVQKPLRAATPSLGTIDPHYSTAAQNHYLAVWDTLVQLDADGKVVPRLAKSWQVVNPTTWEFKLRDDVVFHNNEKLTAKTVKWNIDRIIALKSLEAQRLRSVASVEVVDEYTVRINTSAPDPLLERLIPVVFMLPSEHFEKVGEKAFFENPVGSGPYRFKDFVQDDHTTLVLEPKSWRKATIPEIVFRQIVEASTRMAGLEAGELDFIRDVPQTQAKVLESAGLTVVSGVEAATEIVQFNNTRGGPLADKRVRQALNYAVDKETYLKKVYLGYGEVVEGQVAGKPAFGYNPNIKAYPYDVNKAKQLLAEAGYANGFDEKLSFSVNTGIAATAEAIADFFKAVNVRVQIVAGEGNVYRDARRNGTIESMYIARWNFYPGVDADVALSWFDSSATGIKPAYVNPEFDKIFRPSRVETDRAKREKMLFDAQAFLFDDAASLFLVRQGRVYGHKKDLAGFKPRADISIYFEEMRWA